MSTSSILSSRSTVTGTQLSKTYALVALALAVTVIGVLVGATFALPIVTSGWMFGLFLLELAIIMTASVWSRSYPLNIAIFLLFPFLSGLTITPFLMMVLTGYVNGAAILINATLSTTLLVSAAAIFAHTTVMDIGGTIGRSLMQALIGLVIFSLLQIFFPSLRGSGIEMILSAFGVVVFSLFLAMDMQRLASTPQVQGSAFLLALSLYLDIFNLFLYVVRFMLAFSGNRR